MSIKVVWSEMVFGIAEITVLPVFTESLQYDLDSQEQEPRSYVDLYFVTSFICLGLSGKGRIPWVPDFLKLESKSLKAFQIK